MGFSFLSRGQITVDPDPQNIMASSASRERLLVLVSDRGRRQFNLSESIRIGILHVVDALKPFLQVQAQHRLPLAISNDRLRAARPSTAIIQTVKLDAPSVDFNLFVHGILLTLCWDVNVVVATKETPSEWPLPVSFNTSSGNRYSSPAEPKSTRINFRPKFSMSLTKVPCRGRSTPVRCERISFAVLSESPVFIIELF
jgi:hypothetical protein